MTKMTPLSDLVRDRNYDLSGTHEAVIGQAVYGSGGEKIGTVRELLAEDGGKIRYIVVEVGSWFTSREVVVPVGMARMEDDGVYLDSLTKDQVKGMTAYEPGMDYNDEAQVSDIRTLTGDAYVAPAAASATPRAADHYSDEKMFTTPQRLQLLEERLLVNKEKYVAGSVEVGKRVETRTENVNVDVSHEEVVIERRAVSEPRPVEGNVTLGAATETIRVDLEAERATAQKQAYVTEEVEIGKRTETQQQTISDTVGREVLDVTRTGEVAVSGEVNGQMAAGQDGRNALERGVDAVKDAADPLDGKIDRR
ncbi:PRC and DUF2382 domain-containing protein [Deinococcus koreensis]|uniref:Photosystem reaction center subunit H n=1 Tax=Deinococcus koreensis TaxID=2054903 RepID=A0A2K3USN7_9DEIO|nr:PRC and DUF2382 domain-containing protein [Deinococcus koreensis]PNY79520.1 hypothetical protein CVO96_19020 [Deinococcus koreensis]